jgi:hypothetical protein
VSIYGDIARVVAGEIPHYFASELYEAELLEIAAALTTSLAEATNEDPLRILQQLEEVSLP